MTDITEFTRVLVLMCEWSLTAEKPEFIAHVNSIFVYLPGMLYERG